LGLRLLAHCSPPEVQGFAKCFTHEV
jgi:hypothetical protein